MDEICKKLRREIVSMIVSAREGHIPSSFSIVDIIYTLYSSFLRFNTKMPKWRDRDYFILSKGHGGAALYVVLKHFGFINEQDILSYSKAGGILGGHPDATKVPGAEASTGSLGHGFPFAMGVALGLRIQNQNNRIVALLGDGECNEGTIWEACLVAARQKLGNFLGFVDLNESAAQILPIDPVRAKFEAFGWDVYEVDGHNIEEMHKLLSQLSFSLVGKPKMVIAHTVKGKGVSFVEGHGKWHHHIPNNEELNGILAELS